MIKYYMSQVSIKKIYIFSTEAYIAGVIFMYTWDILFGTPCRLQSIKAMGLLKEHQKAGNNSAIKKSLTLTS